jgi:hypothetical protein
LKPFLAVILLLASNSLFSQTKKPGQKIQVIAGRSSHSTGDIQGISVATEYENYFRKHFSWTIALGGTIHDGFEPLYYEDSRGRPIDGSFRYTTAGLQISSHFGYNFIRTTKHEFQFRAGGLLRYQSSSYFDDLQINYPIGTGYPVPIIIIENKTPQKTYAAGGSCQLLYNYTFNNNLSVGLLGGFQLDTNGDNISQLSLTIGKRF